MTPQTGRRHVGLTVLGGLAVLGWLSACAADGGRRTCWIIGVVRSASAQGNAVGGIRTGTPRARQSA